MAKKRTKDEIQKDISFLRNYAERLISFEDAAERLGITLGQLDYTFECMKESDGKQEVKEIKSRIRMLTNLAKHQKNYKVLCFPTSTKLGEKKKSTKKSIGIYIDPMTKPTIMEEGTFEPKKDDILYVVEKEVNEILFGKFLVLDVKVHKNNIKVNALTLVKVHLTEGNMFSQLAGYDLTGTDIYILSRS